MVSIEGRNRALRTLPGMRPAWVVRYAVAVASVTLSVVLKLLIDPLIVQETPFLLIFGAIVISAWFGGLGPGLLATVLAAIAADYLFLDPRGEFSDSWADTAPLIGFVLEGSLISALSAALRRARERTESSAHEMLVHKENARKSEERFRLMVEAVEDYAIFLLDAQGRIATWNVGAQRINGYGAEEVTGRHFSIFHTEEDLRRGHPDHKLRVAAARGRYEEEGLRVRKDGSTFWASVIMVALRDERGDVRGFAKVTRDITESRRAEESLRQSEERYRAVVEQTAEGIFLFDPATMRILEANSAYQSLLGYAPEEVSRLTLYDIVAHDRRSVDDYVDRILDDERYFVGERKYRRKDGSLVDVEVSASVIHYSGKRIICVAARDITERKRGEATLRRSMNSLLALYEAGQVLGSTLEREEIGKKLLEIVQRVFDLPAACIDLLDANGQLYTLRGVGLEDLWQRARAAPEAHAARREALQTGEYRVFEVQRQGNEPHGVGLCLPLKVRDRAVGLLEAHGPFSLVDAESIETLMSLANQAASALENARLYEELAGRERELQELVGRIVEAQEEERRKVAYEVHDGLTQIAVAAYQRLQMFAEEYPLPSKEARRDLSEIRDLVQRTVGEARHVIAGLRPTALDDFGLEEAIRLHAERLREDGYEVQFEGTLDDTDLPAALETALFRIAQEALTNVHKHADTRRIRLVLGRRNGSVRLEVRDWGRGFVPTEETQGGPGERVGLASMRERVTLLGGAFKIRSSPQTGTLVVAQIPLPGGETQGAE